MFTEFKLKENVCLTYCLSLAQAAITKSPILGSL